jgi:hypothetical protein
MEPLATHVALDVEKIRVEWLLTNAKFLPIFESRF